MPLPLAIPLALGGIQALSGFIRGNQANAALEELSKQPYPQYLTGQQVQAQANATNPKGFSPEERANFFGTLARLNYSRYRIATDKNPTLTGAINAGINYGNVGGLLGFASQDAALQRQNLERTQNLIRGQSNLNTQAQISNRIREENAYGQAAQDARHDIFGGLNMAGSTYFAAAANGLLGSGFGGAKVPTQGIGTASTSSFLNTPFNFPAKPSFSGFMAQNVNPYSQIYED